jgi:hypothetical protein
MQGMTIPFTVESNNINDLVQSKRTIRESILHLGSILVANLLESRHECIVCSDGGANSLLARASEPNAAQ